VAARRRKQFVRKTGSDVPNVELTNDDHEILLHTFRRRLIAKKQIYSLFPHRSQQKLSRRCTALFDVGLVDKPTSQVSLFRPGAGSSSHALAITKSGVNVVNERYKLDIPYSNWSRRNERLRPQSIEHMLGTTDFMVRCEISARQHEHITYGDALDILLTRNDRRYDRPKPMSFDTPVEWLGKRSQRGIEPDELVQLRYADQPDGKSIANFAIEIDRDTETVEPSAEIQQTDSFFRGSSILKKYVIYANAWSRRAMRDPFGFETFRVLFVTTTPGHMKRFQELAQKYLGPMKRPLPGFVLFSNQHVVAEHADNVLSAPWETEDGKTVYIDGVRR